MYKSSVLRLFLFIYLFLLIKCIKIPAAPYNVKLYCKSGRSDTLKSKNPSLCPTSSTSCGYFEFPIPEYKFNKTTTSIFECVDSSILLNDYEDYEDKESNLFYQYCDHRPRCHHINVSDLNKQFLSYIIRTHSLMIENFTSDMIKFCCSLSHSNLARLIKSNKHELVFSSTTPTIKCNKLTCNEGSIGCLYYEETSLSSHQKYTDFTIDNSEEYIDIKPVKLTFDEDDLIINKKRKKRTSSLHLIEEFGNDNNVDNDDDYELNIINNDGYQCVYMHLNDEIYRYCMMIYAQKSSSRCMTFDGYKVCCCFVNPYETTCNPLLSTMSVDPGYYHPNTSTSLPKTTTFKASLSTESYDNKLNINKEKKLISNQSTNSVDESIDVSTTKSTILSINQRTRCRTVIMTESRPHSKFKTKPRTRKKIICDDIRSDQTSSSIIVFINFFVLFIMYFTFI